MDLKKVRRLAIQLGQVGPVDWYELLLGGILPYFPGLIELHVVMESSYTDNYRDPYSLHLVGKEHTFLDLAYNEIDEMNVLK
jgi:hypothetical protein